MSEEIGLVMEYERRQGRNPEDVSRKYLGYDVRSGDRLIEVKRRVIKYGFLYLTANEFLIFQKNENAYLYLVYYENSAPKLRILDRDAVLRNSKISVRYQFRWRKRDLENLQEIDLE